MKQKIFAALLSVIMAFSSLSISVFAQGSTSGVTVTSVANEKKAKKVAAPKGLRAIDVSYCSITLLWDLTSGADGYFVYMRDPKLKVYQQSTLICDNTYTVSGLYSQRNYSFYVASAKRINGEYVPQGKSKKITVKTDKYNSSQSKTALATPKNMVCSHDDGISFVCEWDKVKNASAYHVYYSNYTDELNGQSPVYFDAGITKKCSLKISSLTPETTYVVYVFPMKKDNGVLKDWGVSTACTKNTGRLRISDESDSSKRLPAPDYEIKELSKTKVRIEWNKVKGADGYAIYTLNVDDEVPLYIIPKDKLYIDIDVQPGSYYVFSVAALKLKKTYYYAQEKAQWMYFITDYELPKLGSSFEQADEVLGNRDDYQVMFDVENNRNNYLVIAKLYQCTISLHLNANADVWEVDLSTGINDELYNELMEKYFTGDNVTIEDNYIYWSEIDGITYSLCKWNHRVIFRQMDYSLNI